MTNSYAIRITRNDGHNEVGYYGGSRMQSPWYGGYPKCMPNRVMSHADAIAERDRLAAQFPDVTYTVVNAGDL